MTGEDAGLAVEHGAAAVIVSNHGGQACDQALATADVLPEIVDAVDGRLEVLIDGGIRSGADVLRALALGARAVLIGRPALWGLVVGGADGTARILNLLKWELESLMATTGARSIAEIDRTMIALRDPTPAPSIRTARPHAGARGWTDPIGADLAGSQRGHRHDAVEAPSSAKDEVGQAASAVRGKADASAGYPRAVPGLEWIQTDDGFIATRAGHPTGLVLNSTAALVLELANGHHSVAEIVEVVAHARGLADPPQAEVTTFLDAASQHGLIEMQRTAGTQDNRTH